MDWEKGRESDNVVEDDGGGGGGLGSGGGMQFGGFHVGLGGLLVIIVVSLLFGKLVGRWAAVPANDSSFSGLPRR